MNRFPEKRLGSINIQICIRKIMSLEIEYRVPLVLYYLNQYTIKEIGQMLDLGDSAVKMRLSRARKMMRRMYEQEDAV